jgi:DHA1 family inner membrane transport protein
MSWKERMVLILLAGLNFTHILDFMIMMPLGNYLMPYFKISAKEFSFLVGAYTISAAISGFTIAFFVDHYDRKKVLLVGYGGFLLGTIACGLAPSFPTLFAARVFAGLFGGIIGAQVLSIISDMFGYERRGMAMGMVMSSFAIASTLGVPFALYLANLISWHAPFLLVGILGVVMIPLMMKFIPTMTAHMKEKGNGYSPWDALTQVLKSPRQQMALLFSALIMLGHFLIIPFINPYLEFNMGYSKAHTPMIYLAGGIGSFFAANLLGRLADRYGKLPVFTISVMASLLVVFAIVSMPVVPFALVLVVYTIWFILSTGRGVTAQAMISNVAPIEQRGSFMSFNSSVQQLGTTIASLVAGFVIIGEANTKIQHFNWLGYLSIAILFSTVIIAQKLFKGMETKSEVGGRKSEPEEISNAKSPMSNVEVIEEV